MNRSKRYVFCVPSERMHKRLRILAERTQILSGKGGAGLEETAQESDQIQTDVVKGQGGMREGIVQHGTRVSHGCFEFKNLSNLDNICVPHLAISGIVAGSHRLGAFGWPRSPEYNLAAD